MKNKSILKKQAALRAVQLVQSEMVVGLGSGTTFRYALEELGRRVMEGEIKNVIGIASSLKSEKLAREQGIVLTTFEKYKEIDITIDGADEVDPDLNLIKGGGGALLREKVLAQASKRNIIVVDESKIVNQLGSRWPVPVEVIPFAWHIEEDYLHKLGCTTRLRKTKGDKVYLTDQGNYILDCKFNVIASPDQLAVQLDQRAGIMAHGLFLGLATDVIVAGTQGIRHITRRSV